MTATITEPERRIHQRYRLSPMHAPVTVQPLENLAEASLEGHAYDISESGVRIELDEPIEIGRTVALHLGLPGQTSEMFVAGEVVWVNDEDDDPGPRRMALRFTNFLSEGDRARLLAFVGDNGERMAA